MSKWSFEKLLSIVDAVVLILKFAINQFAGSLDEE